MPLVLPKGNRQNAKGFSAWNGGVCAIKVRGMPGESDDRNPTGKTDRERKMEELWESKSGFPH